MIFNKRPIGSAQRSWLRTVAESRDQRWWQGCGYWIRANPNKFAAILDEMIRRQNGQPPIPVEGPDGWMMPETTQNSEPLTDEPIPE